MMQVPIAGQAAPGTGVLWWVTDQLPYPPRNGITLPSYHHALALGKLSILRLVVLHPVDQPPDAEQLAQNESIFGPVVLIPLRRYGAKQRMAAELRGQEMFQHGYVPDGQTPRLAVGAADSMLVTPMSAVAKLRACDVIGLRAAQRRLALVNDCTAGEYRYRLQSCGLDARAVVKGVVDLLRSAQIGRIERALLADYDHVLLQTPRDIEVFKALVGAPVAERALCVPNGVHPSLSSLQTGGAKRFVFLAELSGEHGALANWLVSDVWPGVQAGDWELLIVGKGASPALKAKLAQAPAVRHVEFVDKIASVYEQAAVALSPVFKGFGLINKTIEPMATGLPVVGGRAAFNGIAGFADGEHGICCDRPSPQLFAQAMQQLMNDAARRAQIGAAARRLVQSQFDWERSTAILARLLALDGPATAAEARRSS